MPERRKVFRVEKMTAAPIEPPSAGNSDRACFEDVMRELTALRAMLGAPPSPRSGSSAAASTEVRRLVARLGDIRTALVGAENAPGADGNASVRAPMTRVVQEIEAAVQASEQATQKILAAAEEIDQAANILSAAVKGESEQGLAQDIRDRVIAIFEACNFQDVTSQRLAKVRAALAEMKKLVGNALREPHGAVPDLHGPFLDGDHGHVSQNEVDSLFAGGGLRQL